MANRLWQRLGNAGEKRGREGRESPAHREKGRNAGGDRDGSGHL